MDKDWAEGWEELDQTAAATPASDREEAHNEMDSMGDGKQDTPTDNVELPPSPLIVGPFSLEIPCLWVLPFEKRLARFEVDLRLEKVPK